MKRILKILAAVLLVVGSFGGGMAYEKSVSEMAHILRVQGICEREGVIFTQHFEGFSLYYRCVYTGNSFITENPLI